MGNAHPSRWLGWTVGLTLFLAVGVVAFASGSPNQGPADAGPPGPIPQTTCGDPPPCTLPNGCAGVKAVCNTHGTWSGCICNGGGDTVSCKACGVAAGTTTCSSSCTPGICSVTPQQQCNPMGCSGAGIQTCNLSTNQWGNCTGCSGTVPCPTSCGSTGTASCSCTGTGTSCTPPAEVCNGKDDDCDGKVDNGITCNTCDSP